MKAKSMKLRTLITLHALYKYSDKNHRLNKNTINPFLKPYGLDCTSRVLSDTVRIMREYGIDVRQRGEWDKQGVWIEDHLLSDEMIQSLVFAVSTNPYLSREAADNILKQFVPLATVYQEPELASFVQTDAADNNDERFRTVYSVISQAIALGRRILYTVEDVRYSKKTLGVYTQTQWATLFSPKCIYKSKSKRFFVVGYNHPDKRIEAIELNDIVDVKISFKHHYPNETEIATLLSDVDPRDYVPEEKQDIIYDGPAEFRCRGQYIELMYRMFGEPAGPIKKDKRGRIVYAVKRAVICPETLLELKRAANTGCRIKGPEGLKKAIKEYYESFIGTLLDSRLLPDGKE